MSERFTYKLVRLEGDQLACAQDIVKRGEKIFSDKEAPLSHLASLVAEIRVLVHSIDPLGQPMSHSIADDLHHAQWYGGASPKSDQAVRAAYSQQFGIARALISNQIKIVAARRKDLGERTSRCVFHRRDLTALDNLVFTLMPFTEPWSDYIWRNEIKSIVESLSGYSLTCRRADDLYGQDVMVDVYESIVMARIIIAEITNKNPNVFYELGLAHALGKDVIILTQGADHIPFDLRRFRHCIYSNDGPGYEKLRQWLPNAIREILIR